MEVKMSREEGFTVIQLLVVIVVVAVVSGIAIPPFLSHQRSVQFSSAVLDFKSMVQRAKALSAIEGTNFRIDFADSITAVVSRHSPPPQGNYVLTGDTLRLPPRIHFDLTGGPGVFYFYPDGRADFTADTLTILMTENTRNIRTRRLFLLPAIGEVVTK
jgi:type II secretory pathway pseudopilin PulG